MPNQRRVDDQTSATGSAAVAWKIQRPDFRLERRFQIVSCFPNSTLDHTASDRPKFSAPSATGNFEAFESLRRLREWLTRTEPRGSTAESGLPVGVFGELIPLVCWESQVKTYLPIVSIQLEWSHDLLDAEWSEQPVYVSGKCVSL